MSRIALIDTRLKIPGESIGTIVSTHETIGAAFKANEAFQKRMRGQRREGSRPTKIVTLKVRWATVNMSIQACTCFRRERNQGRSEG